ncbi:hypothetical protein B2A_12661, partial [mine drainage metagenome]
FSVNYNVRTAGADDYWTTIGDPNFAALEDRMLLRFHPMTRERFRAVEASAERLELGEMEFELAGRIRDHLTLVHAIQTGHPLVAPKFRRRPIRLERPLYDALRAVSERSLKTTPFRRSPPGSSRAPSGWPRRRRSSATSASRTARPCRSGRRRPGSPSDSTKRRSVPEKVDAAPPPAEGPPPPATGSRRRRWCGGRPGASSARDGRATPPGGVPRGGRAGVAPDRPARHGR